MPVLSGLNFLDLLLGPLEIFCEGLDGLGFGLRLGLMVTE